MRRAAVLFGLFVCVACASGPSPNEVNLPPPSPEFPPVQSQSEDPRVAQLQTAMTELLERMDVMNDRLAKLENGQSAPAPAATVAPASVPASANPAPAPAPSQIQQPHVVPTPARSDVYGQYRNALVLFGKNRWADARAAFQQVFDADRSGELADNALYWIGETYYAAGDYANAMRMYARVTKEFPTENKAPDAMFKMGLAYAKTGDLAMARKTFEDVIKTYPYATPAASAKVELNRIKY
jgi:tol-pal system protein YbgF